MVVRHLVGWVHRSWQDRRYGFIKCDADPEVQYFFRIEHTKDGQLPPRQAFVSFDVIPQGIPGKCDRATNVQVVSGRRHE